MAKVPMRSAANYQLSSEDAAAIDLQVGTVFRPATPINRKDLFFGRLSQVRDVIDSVVQPGRHAVIYGERGVGKTSLANVILPTLNVVHPDRYISTIVNAHSADTFGSLWTKAFEEITWKESAPLWGFGKGAGEEAETNLKRFSGLSDSPTPDNIRRALTEIRDTVFIFDEFDRLNPADAKLFTDLLKMLSDFSVDATIIVVGVADTVNKLIKDHRSIGRGLEQVLMPRMSSEELADILTNAEKGLGIKFEVSTKRQIVGMCNGLPHYTHLLGSCSVRSACGRQSALITEADVLDGARTAIRKGEFAPKKSYDRAVHSPKPTALHRQVLLALALTPTNHLGYFQPSQVVGPLGRILDRDDVQISTFQRHLTGFCKKTRGACIEVVGQQYKKRYRFRDPMMPPYIIMNSLSRELISMEVYRELMEAKVQSD